MNKGADALSRRYLLLSTLESKVLGFECIKAMYTQDEDFNTILERCSSHAHGPFHLEDGFLFKGTDFAFLNVGLESF